MKTVWRVFAYLKRYPWLAAGTLTCAIFGTLMVIVFPSVTKWIIEDVVRANRPDKLLPLILLAAVAFVVQHLFNSLRIILNNTFEQKVIFDLRSDLYSHIQLLPLRWFDNRATGDLMTRVIEDVNSVERVLIDGIEQGVVAVLQIVIVVAVMFYWNAKLALLALVPLPLLIAGALAVHADGASAISIAAARRLEHQRAVARQSCRRSSDQKLRPRTRRARAFQSRQRSTATRHTGGDADMGNLLAVDVDVRSNRRVASAGIW